MTGKNNGLHSRQNLIDAISRVDFYSFVQRIFPIVSAGSPFLPNWHVEAITYALTCVMRGEIKRLIITVPPRSLQSRSAPPSPFPPSCSATIPQDASSESATPRD